MRTILLLIFMLASSLLFSTLAFAQSGSSTRTRLVKGQVLTSSYLPPIRVKFDKAFTYIGTQNFVLYGRAQVEQYFFIAADSRRLIKRMYMVQFESYLPNASGAYNYTVTRTIDLAGQSYIADSEVVPNVSAAIKQDPQSDV